MLCLAATRSLTSRFRNGQYDTKQKTNRTKNRPKILRQCRHKVHKRKIFKRSYFKKKILRFLHECMKWRHSRESSLVTDDWKNVTDINKKYIYVCTCIFECMYLCMYVWLYVCMYEYMFVCMYVYIQDDSFGTRPKKMRISQRLFIRFWTCIYDYIPCFMKSMSILQEMLEMFATTVQAELNMMLHVCESGLQAVLTNHSNFTSNVVFQFLYGAWLVGISFSF